MNGTLAANLKSATAGINAIAGEDVTYLRAGAESDLRMRPTGATYAAKEDSTLTEQWSGTDWNVDIESWNASQLDTPLRGDKIVRPRDAGADTYELVAPPGMQLYNFTTFRDALVIHTQLVPTT